MSAPKPPNFSALANAWDNPAAFATELAKYYQHLEASGHRLPAPTITTARPDHD
ncbi:MAG: hypothetical protein ACQEW8_07330 [Actinomycetota bacterium]